MMLLTARSIQNDRCAICLESLDNGQAVVEHEDVRVSSTAKRICQLHQECLEGWLRTNLTCPTCRTPLSNYSWERLKSSEGETLSADFKKSFQVLELLANDVPLLATVCGAVSFAFSFLAESFQCESLEKAADSASWAAFKTTCTFLGAFGCSLVGANLRGKSGSVIGALFGSTLGSALAALSSDTPTAPLFSAIAGAYVSYTSYKKDFEAFVVVREQANSLRP